jgi:hypothetical protein
LEVIEMISLIDPQHTRIDHHKLAVQAEMQYKLQQALREAKERRRAERIATRSRRGRRFAVILRRSFPTPR